LTKAKTYLQTTEPEIDVSDEAAEDGFKAMSAEEAQQWRQRNPSVSTLWVIGLQVVAAVAVTVAAYGLSGRPAGISAAYGAMAVIVPAMVLARGLRRQSQARDPAAVFLSFVVWEATKVMLTVALLLAAPKLISAPNWLALVAGFVVTMKAYLAAAWLQSRRQHRAVIN
jgi:ATP synthase protein I